MASESGHYSSINLVIYFSFKLNLVQISKPATSRSNESNEIPDARGNFLSLLGVQKALTFSRDEVSRQFGVEPAKSGYYVGARSLPTIVQPLGPKANKLPVPECRRVRLVSSKSEPVKDEFDPPDRRPDELIRPNGTTKSCDQAHIQKLEEKKIIRRQRSISF